MDSFFKYDYVCIDAPAVKTEPLPFVDIYQETCHHHKGIYPKDQFGNVYGTGFSTVNFRERDTHACYPGYNF